MNERKVSERTGADGSGGARVSRDVAALAATGLGGTYGARCVGPREEDRAAYVLARDRVTDARANEYAARTAVRAGAPGWLERILERVVGVRSQAVALDAARRRAHERARDALARLEASLAAFALEEKWSEPAFENLVTTVGKNNALESTLAASSLSTVGPYMFLIDANAGTAAVGNTMASHAGWTEVGGTNAPAYTGTRKTVAFSAASAGSKTTSAAVSFAITSGGTVGGCGLALGSGASATKDDTNGTMYSAGAFTGGSKVVANGDTLNVTYTATMT